MPPQQKEQSTINETDETDETKKNSLGMMIKKGSIIILSAMAIRIIFVYDNTKKLHLDFFSSVKSDNLVMDKIGQFFNEYKFMLVN